MDQEIKFFCPQCGNRCKVIEQDTVEYELECPNNHRWGATIDVDAPSDDGGQIFIDNPNDDEPIKAIQCAGARADDFFK
tara:strand:- start:66 stop:302 length:237 start_codon:yes stop_codon:yes gene_type:complete